MNTAQQMVDFYIEAEAAVLAGKSIQKGGRTLTFENLSEIRKGRQEWERRLKTSRYSGPAVAEF